jgi:hypothetical protein
LRKAGKLHEAKLEQASNTKQVCPKLRGIRKKKKKNSKDKSTLTYHTGNMQKDKASRRGSTQDTQKRPRHKKNNRQLQDESSKLRKKQVLRPKGHSVEH